MFSTWDKYNWGYHSPRGRETYDYSTIFDGTSRRFTRGEDFKCLAKSFKQLLHKHARTREIKVKIVIEDDDHVVVRAILDG